MDLGIQLSDRTGYDTLLLGCMKGRGDSSVLGKQAGFICGTSIREANWCMLPTIHLVLLDHRHYGALWCGPNSQVRIIGLCDLAHHGFKPVAEHGICFTGPCLTVGEYSTIEPREEIWNAFAHKFKDLWLQTVACKDLIILSLDGMRHILNA